MDDYSIMVMNRHERDILALTLKNRGLNKKIKSNEIEIEKLKKYNREISGRE